MRLLHTSTLKLHDFIGSETPPYAILSHRWENEEVTFQEMLNGVQIQKNGFHKIINCCAQARLDGFAFVWIDTCCIDKSSSAELSEAINSMFQWYKRASVCYAYLSDVHPNVYVQQSEDETSRHLSYFEDGAEEPGPSHQYIRRWMEEDQEASNTLGRSQWFKRGWTLQELIAPSEVWFYGELDGEWFPIGDKRGLANHIAEFTGIDVDTLLGRDLRLSSVAARMSWAANRKTTREEDIAYCLLGIFDVNMPLLYGEGKKSFIRLQEEIMKASNDQSLFLWDTDIAPSKTLLSGLLASTPLQFQDSGTFFPTADVDILSEYSMTNRGIRIELPLYERNTGDYGKKCVAIFQCQDSRTPGNLLGIDLTCRSKEGGVQYARGGSRATGILAIPPHKVVEATLRTIYVKQEPDDLKAIGGITVLIESNKAYKLISIYPMIQRQAKAMQSQMHFQIPNDMRQGSLIFTNVVDDSHLGKMQSFIIVLFFTRTTDGSGQSCKVIHFLSSKRGLKTIGQSFPGYCYCPCYKIDVHDGTLPSILVPYEANLACELVRLLEDSRVPMEYLVQNRPALHILCDHYRGKTCDRSFTYLPNGFTVSAEAHAGFQRGRSTIILDIKIREGVGKLPGPFELDCIEE